MHIVIMGAGISGLLTALELVEQGCQVSIFDQQQAGQAASWAGGGILSPMYPWRYPEAVNHLAQHAKVLYQQWNQKLLPITGIDFEIHDTGMLIFDHSDFDIGLNYAKQHHEPMQQANYMHKDSLNSVNPRLNPKLAEAIYFPRLANIRNPRLLKSIVTYLKQHPSVKFFESHSIAKLHIDQRQVYYALDETGEKIKADQFVIATGAWSERWAKDCHFNIPVQPVQGQMLLFKTPKHWLPTMCMNKVMYLIPRQDGHIVCGSSMSHCGFDISPNPKIRQRILDACLEMVPDLAQFPVVKQWAGLRPSSPNGVPYIGQMPDVINLWMNVGHFRNGLCMGPASARLLRQMMLGQSTLLSPTAYSPERLRISELSTYESLA